MITLIVAVDENYMIGKGNEIPWKCPQDLINFKKITMNSPMIMGRSTFNSLPCVLPGRHHFVVTRDKNNVIEKKSGMENVDFLDSLISAINGATATAVPKKNSIKIGTDIIEIEEEEIFIIGGETIFHEAMENDFVDRVIISKIRMAVEPDESSKYYLFPIWENNFSISFFYEYEGFVTEIWDRDPSKKEIK